MNELLTEIDHVAIAVNDLEAAIAWYAEVFGATVDHREKVESDGVEEALLEGGGLLRPVTHSHPCDSPVAKYLASKGEGLHHIGYRVDNCADALQAVKDAGGRVIDEAPRPGSRGTTVAFVHPKTSFGTLISSSRSNARPPLSSLGREGTSVQRLSGTRRGSGVAKSKPSPSFVE